MMRSRVRVVTLTRIAGRASQHLGIIDGRWCTEMTWQFVLLLTSRFNGNRWSTRSTCSRSCLVRRRRHGRIFRSRSKTSNIILWMSVVRAKENRCPTNNLRIYLDLFSFVEWKEHGTRWPSGQRCGNNALRLRSTQSSVTPFIAAHQPWILYWMMLAVGCRIENIAHRVQIRFGMRDEHRFDGVSKHGRARFWHYSAARGEKNACRAWTRESDVVTYRQPPRSLGKDQSCHSVEFCLASYESTASAGRSVDWKRRRQPMAWAPTPHTFDSLLLNADSSRARRRIRAVECFAVPAGPLLPMAWGQIASIEDWHPERFAWRLDIVPNVDTISCDPCATLYVRRSRADPTHP